ncbi:MAG TPA: DUF6691 family protein [Phenylobacterium sp.]|nr:DUF6691 family protein [Phenylobacterium sp.]
MKVLSAAILGVIFGVGLLVSGMLDPAKVLGFLDVTGQWNPQLAFVMGGAIAVAAPAFLYARRRSASLLDAPIEIPKGQPIDARLLSGAGLFGLGWGIAGICPGPAVVLLGLGGGPAWVFAITMVVGGLGGQRLIVNRVRAAAPQGA